MKPTILGVILLAMFLVQVDKGIAETVDNLPVDTNAKIFGAEKSAPLTGNEEGILSPGDAIAFILPHRKPLNTKKYLVKATHRK